MHQARIRDKREEKMNESRERQREGGREGGRNRLKSAVLQDRRNPECEGLAGGSGGAL